MAEDEAVCPGFEGVPCGFRVSLVGVFGAAVCFPAAGDGAIVIWLCRFVCAGDFLEFLQTTGDVLVGVRGNE